MEINIRFLVRPKNNCKYEAIMSNDVIASLVSIILVQKPPKTKKQEIRKLKQLDNFQAQHLLLKLNCQNQSQSD